MAQLIILYWRDIPAQVIVKQGRKSTKRQLSERFEKAIDRAAMRAKLHGTDAYLAQWRRGAPAPVDGADPEADADAEAARLEAEFDEEKLREMIAAGGFAQG